MSNEDPLSLIESRASEGERGPTYWCIPAILSSLFFLCFPFFLSQCSLLCYDFFPRDYYYHDCDPPPSAVHGKGPLYSVCRDRILLF